MRDWNNLIADENHWMGKHYTRGRRGKQIRAIVLHHNAANLSLRGCWSVWQTRKASAHYQVDISGRIGQYVHDGDMAWHAGNANSYTIGIEHANNRLAPAWTISDATLDNGAHLVAALCHAYRLGEPRWGVNVFPHQHFMSTGCPGAIAGAQRDRYMSRARAWYQAMAKGQTTLTGTLPAGKKPKGENMLLREPNGAISEVSGGRCTPIGDLDLVQRLVSAGIPLIQVKQGDTAWWQNPDTQRMGARVREIKDILTDYPGMDQGLKKTSLLRQIAGKLGIESRK
ncbi:peptidoglycan recognition protein family protein [Mobiluncus curtisii]|uniref:peptidoglycan recognition protein family protein n=1 Tax=Mobiluncus curtisii TaxID=2051 RepID=UPI00242C3330|nr:peptidoglycan recognition family protein [Mobiluncus curtisii]